jgi:hypothetical protein
MYPGMFSQIELVHRNTNIYIYRVVLDDENRTIVQSRIIAPFDFNVLAKRNLSNSWYKLKPIFELESQMEAIKVIIFK